MMNGVDRRTKWPYPENSNGGDYTLYTGQPRMNGTQRYIRPHMRMERPPMQRQISNERRIARGDELVIPPNARNVVSYNVPPSQPEPEPIWIVPPPQPPRFVQLEIRDPNPPEPILVIPPPPPKERVIEYQVPFQPPPPKPEWVTVRKVVEEEGDHQVPIVAPLGHHEFKTGPMIARVPDDYESRSSYSDTLLGVRRTIHWELVVASFILLILMIIIAIFVAGLLS